MKRTIIALCLLALPAVAQERKIAVVSLLHAHVWLHLGTMLKGDKVKLVGISETLPNLIARAKRVDQIPQSQEMRPGVPESLFYSDWKKMIDETKPDVVWAFTPTNEHVDVVRYCAPKGIHVIVEKPLAATYKEALEMEALSKKHNILVMTNYGSTWRPATYAVKAAVDNGEIGSVWRLRAMQGNAGPGDPKTSSFAAWLADPVKNGGGALMDFGCYLVNWSLYLKGKPQSVYASSAHLKPQMFPAVEDHATLLLNYADGISILEATWDMPPAQRSGNEIYGTKGSITGNQIRRAERGAVQQGGTQAGGEAIANSPLPPGRSEPIAYMLDRIRTKQQLDGPSSLELNVAVQEVLEAAKLSIRTGKAVALPLNR